MVKLGLILSGTILALVSVCSCSSGVCFEDTDPLVLTYMYSNDTKELLACDSVRITAIAQAGDSLLFSSESVSQFSFELDPASQQSVLVFSINTSNDTVTITYTNTPHLISPECGFTFYNNISEIVSTHHIIDTITIDNKSVTLDGERNLLLFY